MRMKATWALKKALRACRSACGSQSVEYALILVLVSLALIGALTKLSSHVEDKFEKIVSKIDKA